MRDRSSCSRVTLAAFLCGCVVGGPGVSGVRAEDQASPVLAEFDLDAQDGRLTVPLRVAERAYRFELATRDVTCFGRPFLDLLPPLPAGPGAGGDDGLVAFRGAPRAWLGPLAVQFPRPFVECATDDARTDGAHGKLGIDVLLRHVLQLDFDRKVIRLLRAVPEDAGDRFHIISLQGRPRYCAVMVKASCAGEPAETFSVELERPDAIYLCSSLARRLFGKGELVAAHHEPAYDQRGWSQAVATARCFALGRFKTQDVRAVLSNDNSIGLRYLSRFAVTFDFPNGVMYLRPGRQFERVETYDLVGIDLPASPPVEYGHSERVPGHVSHILNLPRRDLPEKLPEYDEWDWDLDESELGIPAAGPAATGRGS